MDVSVAEAKNRLPELIRAVEQREEVVITRHRKPAVQLAPLPPERRKVRLGRDAPVDLDRFLQSDI